MPEPRLILRIALPCPLYRTFDYLPPAGVDAGALLAGTRVRVPFGRTKAIGIVVGLSTETTVEEHRLKPALEVLDAQPIMPPDLLHLAEWASTYYRHPLGEVIATALPVLLRKGEAAQADVIRRWRLSEAGARVQEAALARAPRQAALHALLAGAPDGVARERLQELPGDWPSALRAMVQKGWVEIDERPAFAAPRSPIVESHLELNAAQHTAVTAVTETLGSFQPFLMHGVTGSGKTEVYLQIVDQVLERGEQALILVPEIGLTPQLVARFEARFADSLAVLHSGLSERERLNAWLGAAQGRISIIIGTRSAIFTPLQRPGIIIVDEEHDASFKQHEGFRYSARDLAVIRARSLNIPVLLASATPALESLHNALERRYRLVELPERAGAARHPDMRLLDMRGQFMEDGLSQPLLQRMAEHLARKGQVLLFLNRRGYAPTLLCHDCGWVAECHRCDAHMTLHQARQRLRCHHCGSERPVEHRCPACGSVDLRAVGQGTERMESALQKHFPDAGVVRIDRDSTRRKGSLESKLASIHSGESRILIGTQMLAKGHDFPDVTLVGIVDTDQGLFSADFRAGERMAQLVLQVAGRAGRADRPGEVVIQTHHPDHPLLQLLIRQDYLAFARGALAERREAGMPPYSSLALVRAEATRQEAPYAFLQEALARAEARGVEGVYVLGPVAAPMERRQGRFRAQLLVQAEQRRDLHRLLSDWVPELEQLPSGRKVRWSVDVDPVEMF